MNAIERRPLSPTELIRQGLRSGSHAGSRAVVEFVPPGFEPSLSLRRPAMAAIVAITVGFGGFLVWGFTANLDSAAVAAGTVVADSKKKTVSHLEGGILKEVLVAEGDKVKAGQPLLQLDDTRAHSDLAAATVARAGLLARLSRLRAEQMESGSIVFPDELLTDASPIARSVMTDEQRVFDKRRDIYQAKLAAQASQIQQLQAEADALAAQAAATADHMKIVTDQLSAVTALVVKGVAPARQETDLQAQLSEISGSAGQYAAEAARANQAKASGEIALQSLRMEWQGDVANNIQDTQLKLNDAVEHLRVASDIFDHLTVRAPEDGTVLNLQVRTAGGAVGAGQPLLDIEPANEPLVIEARLSPLDIDAVSIGAATQVRVTAYNPRVFPPLDGRLTYIAPDHTEDLNHGAIYYTVRAAIDEASLKAHPHMALYPGMPAELVVKRRPRRAIEYILEPLAQTFSHAFHEE